MNRGKEGLLMVIAVGLGLLAILQFGVLKPAIRSMMTMRSKVRISVQDLARLQSVVNQKKDVETAYKTVESQITSNKTRMQEIMDILLSVEKAAKDSGVEILSNSHVKDADLEFFDRHTINFRGRGTTENLMSMLYALQDPHLLLKIPAMKFVVKNDKIEMELEITRIVLNAKKNDKRN